MKTISPAYSLFVTFWFCLFTIVLYFQFKKIYHASLQQIPLFIGITIIWFLLPLILQVLKRFSLITFNQSSLGFWSRLKPSTMLVKYAEVIFQQSFFLYTFAILLRGVPSNTKILAFTAIISIIHLGNLFFIKRREAIIFFLLSIPMAFFFGMLLTKGLIFATLSIHLFFYLLLFTRLLLVHKFI